LLRPAAGSGVSRVSRCPSHLLSGGGDEPPVSRAVNTLRRVPLVSSRAASLRSVASLPLPSVLLVHRGRRPRPPESVGVPSPPAEAGGELASAEAFAGASLGRSSRHPPKWAASRPEKRAPRALPSTFRRLPKQSVAGACRSGRRAVGNPLRARGVQAPSGRRGTGSRGLPKQVRGPVGGSVPAEAGPWLPCGCALPAEAGSGGPAWDGVPRQPKLSGHRDRYGLPAEACSSGTGRCRRGRNEPPSSIPGRGWLRPTEVGPEPEDPALGLLDAPIRRSGPPHPPGGPGIERRGGRVPKHLLPSPLGRRSSRQPSGEPVSRFSRSAALRGSGRLRGLAPLTSPLRPHRRFQRWAARVSHGLFPLRGPPASAAVPRRPCAEALGSGGDCLGPKPGAPPGKAPAVGRPTVGESARAPTASREGGFRSIPSRVARDAPSEDCSPAWFRRAAPGVCPGARVASAFPAVAPLPGVPSALSRRPPWGFRRQRARKDAKASFRLGFEAGGLAPAA
jgi:hypothetical protein